MGGHRAKPHREVHPGDEVVITRPLGRSQRVRILTVADRHIAKAEARKLYENLTPPPTPEEVEMRRLARTARLFVSPPGTPDRDERRIRRRLRGKS